MDTSSNFPTNIPRPSHFDGDDAAWAIAVQQATGQPVSQAKPEPQDQPITRPAQLIASESSFWPRKPQSISEAGLRESLVESLILKFLLNTGPNSGRDISSQVALRFRTIEPMLRKLKDEQLVVYKGLTATGDYTYELTPSGVERARAYVAQSTYFGSSPVPLKDYVNSVDIQACRHQRPTVNDVRAALSDLVLNPSIIQQVGEAVNLGMGFFLHGPPGNGKTSIAERVTSVYQNGIWIPRAVEASGEIIRVYDSSQHEQLEWPTNVSQGETPDRRWVFIKRPTIMVGGELRMDNLEISTNAYTKISEAPIQMKSNGGTLVIDDFGRQKFPIEELLNRLIVPLERRTDILNLNSGRSFEIPFDLLIVFSTNLPPEDLVDEAFLRRIPFTIEPQNPSEEEFRQVFDIMAKKFGLSYHRSNVDHLLQNHFGGSGRPLRFCHARDVLRQVHNSCDFMGIEKIVTNEALDSAVKNCLAIRIPS